MSNETVRTDKRWRGPVPVPAPEGMRVVTRQRAADMCAVSARTVSRWADTGVLTKYLDLTGRVVFSASEVGKVMRARARGIAETVRAAHTGETPPAPGPGRNRW